ncbi:MAG: cupin domain-containing protein [Hydrogenophaga sp.]|uniref:cupin domain-containing protein n=1 Tax=Hydrogenophaga sp. TaxID=1904254 RepID=UPI0025C05E66|nr:cupin domain-containing protein [Hydrogenophaga sp.]MBT9549967.1 cupin domain-containing protein [Hydrogenophaga sp.]
MNATHPAQQMANCSADSAERGASTRLLPTERVGINGKELAAVELPAGFSMHDGRRLRMREVTIEPGGFLPMHSHASRPAVAFVLQGVMTEYLEGEDQPVTVRSGQSYATFMKPHALQNQGAVPVVFIEIDLV